MELPILLRCCDTQPPVARPASPLPCVNAAGPTRLGIVFCDLARADHPRQLLPSATRRQTQRERAGGARWTSLQGLRYTSTTSMRRSLKKVGSARAQSSSEMASIQDREPRAPWPPGFDAMTRCALPRRAQEMYVRYVQSVWEDNRRRGAQDLETPGAVLGRLHRHSGSDQRNADDAGIPLFRQAYCEYSCSRAWPGARARTDARNRSVHRAARRSAQRESPLSQAVCLRLQRISYARGESDAVSKLKGTYKPKKKKADKAAGKGEFRPVTVSHTPLRCNAAAVHLGREAPVTIVLLAQASTDKAQCCVRHVMLCLVLPVPALQTRQQPSPRHNQQQR